MAQQATHLSHGTTRKLTCPLKPSVPPSTKNTTERQSRSPSASKRTSSTSVCHSHDGRQRFGDKLSNRTVEREAEEATGEANSR
jgi:hypothetical protein